MNVKKLSNMKSE